MEPQPNVQELRLLLDRAPDAFFLHRDGVVVYANRRAAGLLAVDEADELRGRPMPAELLPPDPVDESVAYDVRFANAGSAPRDLEVSHAHVQLDERRTAVVIARDVTERRRLQARLAQADRLATAGLVAATVVHEVNNPLTYVLHFVERLGEELRAVAPTVPTPEGRRALEALEEGASTAVDGCLRMRDIVRDLKTFGRSEDGAPTRIDVNRVLRSAVHMAGRQVGLRARLDVVTSPVPAVLGHEGRLCQVFLNLLLNAAQAIDGEDAGAERVVVTTEGGEGQVQVAITDSGSGVPPDVLPRLFDPFFSTKGTTDSSGSGLGLWISRQIVHEHGGHLEVESRPGEGSTFTVVLPASPPGDLPA
ncbi:MAG: nitrogen regulation protein NR(II) [Sandaracinaceae bacterium]